MTKRIFLALALLTGSVAFAQKKVKQPPPPPPPVVDVKEIPPPPKTPPPPIIKRANWKESYSAFLKRNPRVKGIGWTKRNAVIIRLKSGKEEVYDLSKEEDVVSVRNKYGQLPAPPPPPPSAPFPPPRVQNKRTQS